MNECLFISSSDTNAGQRFQPHNRTLEVWSIFANNYCANSVQENCDPLSENTCSGIPCLARIPFIFMMMDDARVE